MLKGHPQAETAAPQTARIGVAILFFLNGTIIATWAARLPTVQARLALRPDELGLALLGAAIGALVAMNLTGYLAARFGSRSVTTVAALCLCLILPLLALAPTLPVLVTTLIFFGASNGSMDVAMNTQGVVVERLYGRPILNSFHACWSLGGLVGALAGGIVASHNIVPLPQFLGIAFLCITLTLSTAHSLLPARAEAQKTHWGPRAMVRLGGLTAALGLMLALIVPWVPIVLLGS